MILLEIFFCKNFSTAGFSEYVFNNENVYEVLTAALKGRVIYFFQKSQSQTLYCLKGKNVYLITGTCLIT